MLNRLLIVRSTRETLSLLRTLFTSTSYALTHVASDADALSVIKDNGADLVILDSVSESGPGLHLLTLVRAQPQTQHTPIIVFGLSSQLELEATRAGADHVFTSPINPAMLDAKVRNLLRTKESSDALRMRNRTLERNHTELSEATSLIVHDLKNPISTIHLNARWVMAELDASTPHIAEALDEIQVASTRLRTMVDSLLTTANRTEPCASIQIEPIDVTSLLAEAVRAHTRMAGDRILEVRAGTDAVTTLHADSMLVRRAIDNLLDNAIRYSPPNGRILIQAVHDGALQIVVSNTGPSIPECDREEIFRKFTRGRYERIENGNAGLGLYFCKQVTEVHGGTLRLLDSEEWPVSFAMTFPTVPSFTHA